MKRLLTLAIGLAAATAAAQESARSVVGRQGTPIAGALELKLGSYKPLIDTEAGLTGTPYADTFGAGGMLLFELEWDHYLYRGVGAAGVAFSAGYAGKTGRAVAADGTPAEDVTTLFVLPLRLGGVYRFDWAAQRYGIPVVPYAKLGLVYAPWWVTKGDGVETVGGRSAVGGRWGYGGTIGVSLLLDVLDQRLARDFDSDLGVNHSYLFGEFTYADVNNFGSPGLVLSSRHWMFGLMLEI